MAFLNAPDDDTDSIEEGEVTSPPERDLGEPATGVPDDSEDLGAEEHVRAPSTELPQRPAP